jgi:hypothetical protein
MVHFMCRHSYHQRCAFFPPFPSFFEVCELTPSFPLIPLFYSCLGENESQCPNCALTHGVMREIRKSNAQLASRHDLFLQEVNESDDGFKAMAGAFGRGIMAASVPVEGV